jgi:hypothetical protein
MARPTTYDPTYCDRVVEYGKAGKSVAWIAAELDVHKDTIYEWMKVHPEFSDAMTRARLHAQKWWEDAGQDGLLMKPGEGSFNASVWSRSMAARFPEDWRESKGVELTGRNGGPVEVVDGFKLVPLK